MIQKINLLHYLTEDTYKKICVKLNLDVNATKGNVVVYKEKGIRKIELYNIDYKEFGHVWFMDVEIDFPKFACDYDVFKMRLYDEYHVIFGENIMSTFPSYNELSCSYIEYSSILELDGNLHGVIDKLREKCVPEQLDKSLWDKYRKPHGTIEFCVDIKGNTLEILARCHGTALKKRVIDVALHKTVGLIPSAAINKNTESDIMNWLYKRYRII